MEPDKIPLLNVPYSQFVGQTPNRLRHSQGAAATQVHSKHSAVRLNEPVRACRSFASCPAAASSKWCGRAAAVWRYASRPAKSDHSSPVLSWFSFSPVYRVRPSEEDKAPVPVVI